MLERRIIPFIAVIAIVSLLVPVLAVDALQGKEELPLEVYFPWISGEQAGYEGVDALTPSRAVLLEHNLIANGTLIEGSAPYRTVDFPSYWYNENTREIYGDAGFPINESLVMIYGDALTLTGDLGAGTGNKLYGIYSLPASIEGTTILSVDRYGKVGMIVNNSYVTINPGDMYSYTVNETIKSEEGVMEVLYNHTYENRGIIPKDNVMSKYIAG